VFDEIEKTINEMGSVLPKLDWSSPKDAAWMGANTLKCSCVGEILMLLKSSDSATHDLLYAYDNCHDLNKEIGPPTEPTHLILREFFSLDHSMEFRCFVKASTLIGTSLFVFSFFLLLVVSKGVGSDQRVDQKVCHKDIMKHSLSFWRKRGMRLLI